MTCTTQVVLSGREESLQRAWATIIDRDLQTRCHPGDTHASFTLLLTENRSFFSFSVISPETFRASFKFSYSLQRDQKSLAVCESSENFSETNQDP